MARSPKISRIRPVRSMTLAWAPSSSDFCWTGVSAASTTSSPALCSWTSSAISSTWPLPSRVAGRTERRRYERRAATLTPIASASPCASSSRASAVRREPAPLVWRPLFSGTTSTARSPRVTSLAPLPSKLFRGSLRAGVALLAIEVEGVLGLQRRDRVLVDQLHLAGPLEHQRELVVTGDRALQHHPIDQEYRHALLVARRGGQEQVLERRSAAAPRRFASGSNEIARHRGRHDGRDRMFVDELRGAIAAQQQRERVEPGNHALQLDA